MFVERNIKDAFERVNSFFSVVLMIGARHVSKSTFPRKIAEPGRKYVSLDPLDVQKQAREDPRLFLANNPAPVIFDEIQNVPELLPYIKALVDEACITSPEKAKGMFWLTDSQQFHLMKGVSESLAGRIGILNLYGLSNAEIEERKSQVFLPDIQSANVPVKSPIEVFERIWRGSYPEIATANPDTNMWSAFFQSYIQTYLMRDVRALTQVADEHKFYDFLRAVAARTRQMLNYSSLARDADISQPTAKSYLSILETSGIVKLSINAATVLKADIRHFNKLSNSNMPLGTGALISLYPDAILINENVRLFRYLRCRAGISPPTFLCGRRA